ncbi:MAG: cyclic pyranopterin monophosphate synthase accessory protein [Gammaproteobacteria bacterium]|nr:MAG: cyclic pyranopterin monophosphate synthase MoaC [Pseudomonadota bacterium]MBC6944297.1 cyclic pyranopterin monophosphate synthase MoaC [Gammaproteobacteria bacterium]MCE7896231.1 cyclic pyranopterin monophosphate synthase MoaC [Gammaproteobacteria bacterium PRO8]MDL1879446.1 cyclic pyranopterin monophosphate synthase MoaC [Gammaproteobacteria bacterium PRO2]MCL4777630.1 cyclic pyranopterin monophosphate synthase MoaC [Gammaproteobacteria bacterium]
MFSHLDADNQPTMVDVSGKPVTHRTAVAQARVLLPDAVRAALVGGELRTPKGPVFQTAIIAGTMAAKRTHELIPFCHPLALDAVKIGIRIEDGHAVIDCQVRVEHRTGVEMEALTGASVAALTVYDMCKALSHDMVISDIRLVAKTGGKSDYGTSAPPHG